MTDAFRVSFHYLGDCIFSTKDVSFTLTDAETCNTNVENFLPEYYPRRKLCCHSLGSTLLRMATSWLASVIICNDNLLNRI